MEKKATASEHLPRTSSVDLNLPLEQSAEQDNNSSNFVNLVSRGRTHHGFRDGDLHGRSSMIGHSSYSDFTGNSTSEAEPNLFQQSVPNTCLSFHTYKRRTRQVDDGTVGSGFLFDIMLPLDVPDLLEINFTQEELAILNMSSNTFQTSSLPSYLQIPDTDSGIIGGNCQIDESCEPRFGRKHPGLKENKHVQIGFDNQGEHVSSDMMSSTLQEANLNDSQTIAAPHLCSGLASVLQSNHGKQNFVSLNQSINHQGHLGYGGPFSFGHKNDSTFMIRPGDQIDQAFNFGQNQHLVIPWTSGEPYTGFVSNIDEGSRVYCTEGAGYNQLSMQTGMSTNAHNPGENKNNSVPYTSPDLSMYVSNINPTPSSKHIKHHSPISDQTYLHMMQNGSLDDHAVPTRTPDDGDNVSHMTPRGLDRHCRLSRASINAAGAPDQLFPPPVQKVYQNNMRNSVANPFTAQMLAQHTLSDQNMRNPGGNNSANANYYYVSSQQAANCYQGLATQQSTAQDSKLLNANKETLLQLYPDGIPRDPALASGNKSAISRSDVIKASQAPSSTEVFIPAAPQGQVAPCPARGRAPAKTPSRRGKPRLPAATPSTLRRRAVAPGLKKKMEPSAMDVIRRSSGTEASSGGRPAPLGARCDLCGVDLAFTPSGAASGTCGDPPTSAVHPCGHLFHDACLRQIGVSTDCKDPPCIACGFIQKTKTAGGR